MKIGEIKVGMDVIIWRLRDQPVNSVLLRARILEIGLPHESRTTGSGKSKKTVRMNNGVKIQLLERVTGEETGTIRVVPTRAIMRKWDSEDKWVKDHLLHAKRRKILQSFADAIKTRIADMVDNEFALISDASINIHDKTTKYASFSVTVDYDSMLDFLIDNDDHCCTMASIDGCDFLEASDMIAMLADSREQRKVRG